MDKVRLLIDLCTKGVGEKDFPFNSKKFGEVISIFRNIYCSLLSICLTNFLLFSILFRNEYLNFQYRAYLVDYCHQVGPLPQDTPQKCHRDHPKVVNLDSKQKSNLKHTRIFGVLNFFKLSKQSFHTKKFCMYLENIKKIEMKNLLENN